MGSYTVWSAEQTPSPLNCPLKKGAAAKNPLEYGKAEVQALFEPLQAAISSMELPGVYLKTANAPGQRAFSRCAASFFLEIRQYSCEKMSCSAQKFLAGRAYNALKRRGVHRKVAHLYGDRN